MLTIKPTAWHFTRKNGKTWAPENKYTTIREKVDADPDITEKLSKEKLDELFSFEKYTRHVDTIFDRVF